MSPGRWSVLPHLSGRAEITGAIGGKPRIVSRKEARERGLKRYWTGKERPRTLIWLRG